MTCPLRFWIRPKYCLAAAILLSTTNSQPSTLFAQGSLTPPGAPAATLKTLQQVEPRTPISSLPFSINSPGSYYLTTNLVGNGGISITAGDSTLDLNGFHLRGTPGNFANGIMVSAATNIVIRNGIVTGWGLDGIEAFSDSVRNLVLEDLLVHTNAGFGCDTRVGAVVRHCTVSANGSDGIYCHESGMITGSKFHGNAGRGIYAGNYSTILDCSLERNGNYGVFGDNGVQVSRCAARRNNGGGISVTGRGVVENCIAEGNGLTGIQVTADCTVLNNNSSGNGLHGIVTSGSGNRVEGNQTRGNSSAGIQWSGNSVVMRNTSGGNAAANYSPSSGATFGPIQNPSAATNAWGNISF